MVDKAASAVSAPRNPSPVLRPNVPQMSGEAGGAEPQNGAQLTKGSLTKFDGLANPFVKVEASHIRNIVSGPKENKGTANRLLKDGDGGKVVLNLNHNNVQVMHSEVIANKKITERFIPPEGITSRFGNFFVKAFRNLASKIGLSTNEVGMHLDATIALDGNRQVMTFTPKNIKLDGAKDSKAGGESFPDLGVGEMRVRRREGVFRSFLRGFFVDSLNHATGWAKDYTTSAVRQRRLDQMTAEAQNMAMKMSWFKDGQTSEADENFATYLETDAEFLKESNFIGGLRAYRELDTSSAVGNIDEALNAADRLIQAGKGLSELSEDHVSALRFLFQRFYRADINNELPLAQRDPGDQNAQAVFQKGQEFRDMIAAEIARGKHAAGDGTKIDPAAAKSFMDGRAERLKKISDLRLELSDASGTFKRMREGRSLIRGMLPVAMLHSPAKLQQFIHDQLKEEYVDIWSLKSTSKYYKDAAQAIYTGIIKGVSESLIESLAMNEADRMKESAKQFVDDFQNRLEAQYDAVWNTGEASLATSLTGASARFGFIANDNSLNQRIAIEKKHEEIANTVKDLRKELQEKMGPQSLSLSSKVESTLIAALDKIDLENEAVRRSSGHVFDFIGNNGLLQTRLDHFNDRLITMLGNQSEGSVSLRLQDLQSFREEFDESLAGLRQNLASLEGDLTEGHKKVLQQAIDSAERTMQRALADLGRIHDALAGVATGEMDTAQLAQFQEDMQRLAEQVKGSGPNGEKLSKDGLLSNAEQDQTFKQKIGQFATRVAELARNASNRAEIYRRCRAEMKDAFEKAPDRPSSDGAGRVVEVLTQLSGAYEAAEREVNEHRQLVSDAARWAGVEAKTLSQGFKIDELDRERELAAQIVAKGLGLNPKDCVSYGEALRFLADLRDETALLSVYNKISGGDPGSATPASRLEKFKALFAGFREKAANNDPNAVGRLAVDLFGTPDRLQTGLNFINRALPEAARSQANRTLRLAVLDESLSSALGKMKAKISQLYPDVPLESNLDFLRALARVDSDARPDEKQLILGELRTLDKLAAAYEKLKQMPGPNSQDSVEDEQLYDQLQQLATVLGGRPDEDHEWNRYQARVAIDQLITNITKNKFGLDDLKKSRDDVQAEIRKAVSLDSLKARPDYDRITRQMDKISSRIKSATQGGETEKILMAQPFEKLSMLIGADLARDVRTRAASSAEEDKLYTEQLLNFGAMMTLADGVLRDRIGGLEHTIVGLNPVDYPDLFTKGTKWTTDKIERSRREREILTEFFKKGGERAGGPLGVPNPALSSARKQIFEKIGQSLAPASSKTTSDILAALEQFKPATEADRKTKDELVEEYRRIEREEFVRDVIVARVKVAPLIDRQTKKAIIDAMRRGDRLHPDAVDKIHRETSMLRVATVEGLKVRSAERVRDFTERLNQALSYAPDYQYFNAKTLKFDATTKAIDDTIRQDNPYRYNLVQKILQRDVARIDSLKKTGVTDEQLEAFRLRDKEGNAGIMRRFNEDPNHMKMGLQLFQYLLSAKMVGVYSRAAEDDRGNFGELEKLRKTYADQTTLLAQQQAIRAAILLDWESQGKTFEEFARDEKTTGRVAVICRRFGFENASSIAQLVATELEGAGRDLPGTLKRWQDEAGQHQGALLKLKTDFEDGIRGVCARLESNRAARLEEEAEEAVRADGAVASMREQTGAMIGAARIDRGQVATTASENTKILMERAGRSIPDGDPQKSAKITRIANLIKELEQEIKKQSSFRPDSSWQEIGEESAEWIRRAERIAAGVNELPPPDLVLADGVRETDLLDQLGRLVDEEVSAPSRRGERLATNLAANEFETEMRVEISNLRKEKLKESRESYKSIRSTPLKDLAKEIFCPAKSWAENDLSSASLETGAREAVAVLDGIVIRNTAEPGTSEMADAKNRVREATVLREAFQRLANAGAALRQLEDIPRLREAREPADKKIAEYALELEAFSKLMTDQTAGLNSITNRSGTFRNTSADGKRIEAFRSALMSGYQKFLDKAIRDIANLKSQLPAEQNLDEAVADVDNGVFNVNAEGSFVNAPVDHLSELLSFLPEHRELCEKIKNAPGGDDALRQLARNFYQELTRGRFEDALASLDYLLKNLESRFTSNQEQPGRRVYSVNDFGLRPVQTRGDGNCFFHAVAAQVKDQTQGSIRKLVADEMGKFVRSQPLPKGVSRPSDAQVTFTRRDAAEHGINAWGDDFHAGYVARALNRPVVLIGNDRALLFQKDQDTVEIDPGSIPPNPVFLIHNGVNHWESAERVAGPNSIAPVQPAAVQAEKKAPQANAPAKLQANNAGMVSNGQSSLEKFRERGERDLKAALMSLSVGGNNGGVAISRANQMLQNLDRALESITGTGSVSLEGRRALEKQRADSEEAFLKRFRETYPDSDLSRLQSLTEMRKARESVSHLIGLADALWENPLADPIGLVTSSEQSRRQFPVEDLRGKRAVVSTAPHAAILRSELALARAFIKTAEQGGRSRAKSSESRANALSSASLALNNAKAYYSALSASIWNQTPPEELKRLEQRLDEMEARLKKQQPVKTA